MRVELFDVGGKLIKDGDNELAYSYRRIPLSVWEQPDLSFSRLNYLARRVTKPAFFSPLWRTLEAAAF